MEPPARKKGKAGPDLNLSATDDAVMETLINPNAACDTNMTEAEEFERVKLALAEEVARLATEAKTATEATQIATENALVRTTEEAARAADLERAEAPRLAVEKDMRSLEADIYKLVAQNMHAAVVQRDGEWTSLGNCRLPISFMCESILLPDELIAALKPVFQVGGYINCMFKFKGWTQEKAARVLAKNTDPFLAILVEDFMIATNECMRAIDKRAPYDWRAAALANYHLVAAQYPCIAINPQLRRPAIADIKAFLDMNPGNFQPSVRADSEAGVQ
jgi:hypothetical protein